VAPASLNDGSFIARARELVQAAPAAARRQIGLEVAEPAAAQHFEALQELGRQLRPFGVQLGLEHAGAGLAQIDRLFQAGLDYVKLDSSVVSGVSADVGRAAFVRSLVVMLRSLSLRSTHRRCGTANSTASPARGPRRRKSSPDSSAFATVAC
jgi:EAL domain-containing protein (putative c-di-GMP-specific phosphodiesterase class I)